MHAALVKKKKNIFKSQTYLVRLTSQEYQLDTEH